MQQCSVRESNLWAAVTADSSNSNINHFTHILTTQHYSSHLWASWWGRPMRWACLMPNVCLMTVMIEWDTRMKTLSYIYCTDTDEEFCSGSDAVFVWQQKAACEHQRADESRSAPGAGRDTQDHWGGPKARHSGVYCLLAVARLNYEALPTCISFHWIYRMFFMWCLHWYEVTGSRMKQVVQKRLGIQDWSAVKWGILSVKYMKIRKKIDVLVRGLLHLCLTMRQERQRVTWKMNSNYLVALLYKNFKVATLSSDLTSWTWICLETTFLTN